MEQYGHLRGTAGRQLDVASLMPTQLLIVDDSASDASRLRIALETNSPGQYAIVVATALEDAIAILARQSFDAAVVDLSLQNSGDLSTIDRLVEAAPKLAIVALVRAADDALATEAVRRGAEDCLPREEADARAIGRAIRYAVNRKLAAEALRDGEERLRLAIQSTGGGTYSFDLLTNQPHFSPELKSLFGLRPEEPLPLDADAVPMAIHPEDRAAFLLSRTNARSPRGDGLFRCEFRIIRGDGSIRWLRINASAEFVGEGDERRARRAAGVVIDITERKEAESALRRSELQYRSVVETAQEGIAIVDPNETFVFVNQAFAAMLGFTKEEMAGVNLHALVGEAEFERYRTETSLRRQGKSSRYETVLRSKKGRPVSLSLSASPLFDDNGTFLGTLSLVADITERQRAETSLRSSEAKYRQLHQTMRDAFVGVALDGRIVECNTVYTDMLGYSEEEVCRLTYMDLTPAKWHAMQARIIAEQVLPRGYSEVFEKEYRRKDGAVFPVDLRLVLLRDDSGRPSGMWGIVRDITDRKGGEESLRHSEHRYHSLFNTMSEGFALHEIVCDERGCPCDYRFLEANAAFERLTGLKPSQVIGKRVQDVLPAIEFHWIEDYSRVAILGEPLHKEKYSAALGRWYDVFAYQTAPGRFAAIFSDVTERKRAEEALQESEERFRSVVEASPDPIAVVGLDGRILMVSHQPGARSFGYDSLDELLSTVTNAFDLLAPEDRQRAKDNITKLVDVGILPAIEYCARRRDGSRFPIELSASLQRDSRGSPHAMIIVLRDITDRKRAQQLLERAKEAAESANRAKSEFLANMSHEIRTPMTAILGFTELLARGNLAQSERHECIEGIRKSSESLLTLIGDILDLSKIEADKLTLERTGVSLEQIIDDVVSVIRLQADKKNLSLKVEYGFPLPETVYTDRVRLRQVLLNLAGNAVKFTSQGEVQFSVRCQPSADGAAKLAFVVRDTGIGIPADEIECLFRPFTQVDGSASRRYGGTGLGLAISKRLAIALGGDITVASELGKGSTFTLTVDPGPLSSVRMLVAERPRATTGGQRSPRSAAPPLQGRVLLAEDDPSIQRIICLLLRKMGLEVAVADTGEAACQMAEQSMAGRHPYDLILMDMQMPKMDGYEATQWLRSHGWQRPIIALTAHAMIGDREKCLATGCTDYVSKPMVTSKLRSVLSPHLAKPPAA